MNKRMILLSFLFFIACGAIAQPVYFNKNYEYSGLILGYTASVAETDSNYFTVGVANNFTDGGPHFMKLTKAGDTVFTRVFNKPIFNFASTGSSGSFRRSLFDSTFFYSGAENTTGNYDAVLYKFNYAGDTIWTKRYGGTNSENGNCCIQTKDSGYLLTGFTDSYGSGAGDFYMVKADKFGNEQWYKTFGTAGVEAAVVGQQTLDGGYILSGRKNNQFYFVKTDSAGNQQWDQSYANTIGVCFVKQLPDSGYILAGSQDISGDLQGCLIRTDKDGNLIWQNNYGLPGEDSWLYSIPVVLWDGSIVCSGTYKPGNGFPDGWLLKTDALGNQMWSRTYAKSSSDIDQFYDLKRTLDNGFLMSGATMMASQDPWLVKVDSNGCLVQNCNVGIIEFDEASSFSVYPNPAGDELYLLNLAVNENTEILIYDVTGRLLRKLTPDFSENQPRINIGSLPPGLLLLSMEIKGRNYYSKVVKD